tara:strand:- start:348 stop:803 length:456 start_codon:yes stop_codon:yes gene_type:complete
MTKKREILSIEFTLSQIINKLDPEEVRNATNKSISHFRKCSDPEDKNHTLFLKDAIQLDILLQNKKLGTPFLDLIEIILNSELKKNNNYSDIKGVLINLGGRMGYLMDTTLDAINPMSTQGIKISLDEKKEVFKAISELEEKISNLKLSIK